MRYIISLVSDVLTVQIILPPALVGASLVDASSQELARGGSVKQFRTLRVRLNPNAEQEQFLNAHCGATKFAYNCTVAYWCAIHDQWGNDGKPKKSFVPSTYDLHAWWKRTKDGLIEGGETWLKDLTQATVRNGVSRASDAIKMFLKNEGKFPRFKRVNESARWEAGFSVFSNILNINRRAIPTIFHNRLPSDARIVAVTVKRQGDGWYASILHETAVWQKNIGNSKCGKKSAVGVDLGLMTFATLNNGERVENPRPLKKALKKLRRQQRHLSRCKKGSNRRRRWKTNIARLHAKVSNTRLYHAQQAAFKLVREYQTICVEDLNVAGMVKNKRLARSISDAGFSVFKTHLQWLCQKYNRRLVEVDRFYPSSKTCSSCGNINKELSLSDREWACETCHTHHDRDVNAAKNILREGLRISGPGKVRLNDAEDAEATVEKSARVECPLNRQGRKAENRTKECEVKEAFYVE